MHYGTRDSLKTAIAGLSASDVLSAGTAYKAYIFSIAAGAIIKSIAFSTEAVPRVGDSKWVDNTLLGSATKLTLSVPSNKIVSSDIGATLLVPTYSRISYTIPAGLGFYRANGAVKKIFTCSGTCEPILLGYAVITEAFTAKSGYLFHIIAIKSVSDTNDVGSFYIGTGTDATEGVGESFIISTK